MILYPSYQKMKRLSARLVIFSLFTSIVSACAYRFTNLHLRPPEGVRTIAIEAIYDTSRSVVPHEALWESLQKEFAADGRLLVVADQEADVYLRAHLASVSRNPTEIVGETFRNPSQPVDAIGKVRGPRAYSNLKIADHYATKDSMSILVSVEVWKLSKKQRLLAKEYSANGTRKVFNPAIPAEARFIQAEEGMDLLFAELSAQVAKQVVRDFLSLPVI